MFGWHVEDGWIGFCHYEVTQFFTMLIPLFLLENGQNKRYIRNNNDLRLCSHSNEKYFSTGRKI